MEPEFLRPLLNLLRSRLLLTIAVLFLVAFIFVNSVAFNVNQYEYAIVTRFGKAMRTEMTPGLKFKVPFIESVERFDNRILAWDGKPTECPTKDKLYLFVDCFARWRIKDPMLYYTRLFDERSALSRLDDILGSETRTAVATHDLVELVRTTKGRTPLRDEELEKSGTVLPTVLPEIEAGRAQIEKEITERSRVKLHDFGIELLDLRFRRTNYNPAVGAKIVERMSSERKQIAARFRSEGRGEAAKINGQKQSDVANIISEATKTALVTEGQADATAARTYAEAYSQPGAQDFYLFLRSLDVARKGFESQTTVVLSTNSDIGRILKSMAEISGTTGAATTPAR
jgi:membrane protease subunit HflC